MPSEALAKEGRFVWYVYLLESEALEGERYIGITSDLKRRIADHNAGKSSQTSKFLPWRIVTYVAFSSRAKATSFERYLNRDPDTRSPANAFGRVHREKIQQ
ncbi:GIY-YIG nuclease family protein [Mesorhizobium sp.]|uniref:GIY-YIG nuclease family protein n=1 Tax=Mesorhizobium sp. TaxID=1871066 RepID=UPI0026CC4C8D